MGEVFKRVEIKYLLTAEQYDAVIDEILLHFRIDEYGESTIQSLYYDTDNYYLIRTSLEKPVYKEKLRLRCYGLAKDDSNVFLELKKKYKGIVYKRRIKLLESEVNKLFDGSKKELGQIEKELVYFHDFYEDLKPKMLILYDRTALYGLDNEMRITLDKRIRYRIDNLNLHSGLDGKTIIPDGSVLMEIKTASSYPIWLCRLLNDNKIFKTSFSKYGTAYVTQYLKND